jgi:Cu(I)/Ag(I) efflux system protein CusF
MKSQSILSLALALGLSAGAPLVFAAGDHGGHSSHGAGGHATASSSPAIAGSNTPVPGEVKKVDNDAGKLTIRHGELKDLGMPAMTMVFQVKDRAMLDQVKAGDQVNFIAEKVDGKLTVTQLEAKK